MPIRSVLAVLAWCVLLSAATATAAQASTRVQFQVLYVTFTDVSGHRGQVPISIAVETPNARSARAICSMGPRVKDALVNELRKAPYPLDRDKKLDTAAIAEQAKPVIERSVGKEHVVAVSVSMDPPKISAATATGAFARLGCVGAGDEARAAKR